MKPLPQLRWCSHRGRVLHRWWHNTEQCHGSFLGSQSPKYEFSTPFSSDRRQCCYLTSLSPLLSYWGNNSTNLKGLLHWLNEILKMKLTVLCPQPMQPWIIHDYDFQTLHLFPESFPLHLPHLSERSHRHSLSPPGPRFRGIQSTTKLCLLLPQPSLLWPLP